MQCGHQLPKSRVARETSITEKIRPVVALMWPWQTLSDLVQPRVGMGVGAWCAWQGMCISSEIQGNAGSVIRIVMFTLPVNAN